jgi:hypothetical protein
MYPHERSLVKRLQNKPFALLGVNSDSDKKELKKAMEKEQITWRSWWNGGGTSGPISNPWKIQGWPTLYLIDHKGVIRYRWLGAPDENTMNKAVDALVKEAETDK